jgi:hypothetical protein
MSECYVEILVESRPITVDKTSAQQQIVIQYKISDDTEPSYNKALFLGEDDDVVALEFAYSIFPVGRWLPGQVGNDLFLILTSIKVEQVNNLGWWKATADYNFDLNTGEGGDRGGDPAAMTLPYIRVGFSVGSRTKTITQSLEVLSRVSHADIARPLPESIREGNVIGASDDNITGAEVYTSGLTLQITAYYFPQYINFTFLNLLAEMFPAVNSDNFLGYSPGEVLIIGCDGSATISDVVPITYTLEVKKNINNRPDPPFPNLTTTGHAIIDYRYVKVLDEAAQIIPQTPMYRIVHRGYVNKPFASLGFPTS